MKVETSLFWQGAMIKYPNAATKIVLSHILTYIFSVVNRRNKHKIQFDLFLQNIETIAMSELC